MPNPYISPAGDTSDKSTKAKGRISSFAVQITLRIFALIALLVSQGYFQHKFTMWDIDLSPHALIALGPGPPLILIVFLVITAVVSFTRISRISHIWEAVSIVVYGLVLGHHIFGICWTYAGRCFTPS